MKNHKRNTMGQPIIRKCTYYTIRSVIKDKSSKDKIYLAERLYGLEEFRKNKIKKSIKEDQKLFDAELIRDFPFEIIDPKQEYSFERKNRFMVDNFWLTPANETMSKSFRSRVIKDKLINMRGGFEE